jgi:hypothetical protein
VSQSNVAVNIADEAFGRFGPLNHPKVREVIGSIADAAMQQQLATLVEEAMSAREAMVAIDLKPFEATRYDLDGFAIWDGVSGQFIPALAKFIQFAKWVKEIWPNDAKRSLDAEALAIEKSELKPGAWTPTSESSAREIDLVLESMLKEEPQSSMTLFDYLGHNIWRITAILSEEVKSFRTRLTFEAIMTDRWYLLSELQEIRHKLVKGLDALIMGVCSSFKVVRSEDIIPGYRTELMRTLQLREHFHSMAVHIQALQRKMVAANAAECIALARELFTGIEHAVFQPGFGWIRASDKRAMIHLRNHLAMALQADCPEPTALMQIADELWHFVEALKGINRRDILVEHDREALNMAVLYLEAALYPAGLAQQEAMASACRVLATLPGRDGELDLMVERLKSGQGDPLQLLEHVKAVLGRL